MGNGLFSRQASSCCPPDPAETPVGAWGRKEGKGKEELEMASSCSAVEQPDSQAAMRGALLQSLATRDPHTALTAAWLMEFGCLSSARQHCNCS